MKKKNNLKRIFCVLIIVAMTFTFCLLSAGCTDSGSDDNDGTVTEIINVGALNGPTGMGAVELIDMTDKYNVEILQAPTDAVSKLISGDLDVACLPSNMASVLYNKTEGEVFCVSPMVMGVLYIMGNNSDVSDISELKGKTILSSGQGGTPEYVLEKILSDAGLTLYGDVNVEWLSSHADVNAKLLTEEGTIAMVPEPFVSIGLTKGAGSVSVLFDLNELWANSTGKDLPMGVLVASRNFVENRPTDLAILLQDLEASIESVNSSSSEVLDKLVEKGFFADASIAAKAIPNCHLTLYAGQDAQEGNDVVSEFNEIMYDINPQAVGGALPGEDLFAFRVK